MAESRMVALLRGVNVGGKRRVPMAELREVAAGIGLAAVDTYIQSGNVVFTSSRSTRDVARALESGIAARFGFAVDVVVRTRAEWHRMLSSCPFSTAAADRPNLLHVCIARQKPHPAAAQALAALCSSREAVALVGATLWIDYGGGVARSKLSSGALDRAAGSTVTARNWKTAQQLAALLG
jgi:uncharacterized protein (DUF1697 family)